MTDTRKDYKAERNKQIYDEYVNSDISFNKLAVKYDLSPQRVRYIVNDFKSRGLDDGLSLTAPKEERERAKNRAVELREGGKLDLALVLFEDVIAWDIHNDNHSGENDVYGHMRLAYNKLAKRAKAAEEKRKYFELFSDSVEKSKQLAEENDFPTGVRAMISIHEAKNLQNMSMVATTSEEKDAFLSKALDSVTYAIENLPGSLAHKSWPLRLKAELLHEMARTNDALETLRLAEKYIYDGYEEEMGWANNRDDVKGIVGNDQAAMKIKIWLAMLHLTYAKICMDTNRNLVAQHYLNGIIHAEDPDGYMANVKTDARQLLKTI